MKAFRIRDAIGWSWGAFVERPWFLMSTVLVVGLVQVMFAAVQSVVRFGPMALMVSLAAMVVSQLMGIGMMQIALDVIDRRDLRMQRLFDGWACLVPVISVNILLSIVGLAVLAVSLGAQGLLRPVQSDPTLSALSIALVLIPAIALLYLIVRLQWALFFVVDRHVGPLQAIRLSWAATSGQFAWLCLWGLTLAGINLLGLLSLGVGLLVTFPVSLISFAYVYRTLLARSETVAVLAEVESRGAMA